MRRDGGPAFPSKRFAVNDEERDELGYAPIDGMTLRDWFAGQVTIDPDYSKSFMEKIVGRPIPGFSDDPLGRLRFEADFEAILRGIKADAIIAERAKAGGAS